MRLRKRVIKALLNFTSDDPKHSATLHNVFARAGKNRTVEMFATNGAAMIGVEIESSEASALPGKWSALLGPAGLKAVAADMKDGSTNAEAAYLSEASSDLVSVAVGESSMNGAVGHVRTAPSISAADARAYPPVDTEIRPAGKPTLKIAFNPRLMADAWAALADMAESMPLTTRHTRGVTVEVWAADKAAVLTLNDTQTGERCAHVTIMPVRLQSPSGVFQKPSGVFTEER